MNTSKAPYVGLDYFLEEDAGLFFGRDAERKRIIGNLRASRLTLLYAESGVGKSSLLRAGVSARLRRLGSRRASARYLPVVFNAWQGEPKEALITALETAARPLAEEPETLELRRAALEDAIEDVVDAVDAIPLVILDQFEERFLYAPDHDGFDDELATCINRRDLHAHFLISIREDAYPLIGPRYKARIPNVYGNYLHLDFLDEQAGRDAVLGPVRAINMEGAPAAPRFRVEAALVDTVIEQVRHGGAGSRDGPRPSAGETGHVRVETAYLQLVMKRLWDEEIAVGSERLRLQTLRRLGGADAIVHGHLDDAMAKLSDDQRDAAAAAFRFLVTSGGRKIALSAKELRDFSDAPAAHLGQALEHLEHERILRPVPSPEPDGTVRHEIYHDVLGPPILDWRRRHAEEQAERGFAATREHARRLEVRNRRLGAAVIGLASIAIALALYLWNPRPLQRLELSTVDARFSIRGAQAPSRDVVLVAIDDNARARLDRGPNGDISRRYYATMLDRLRDAGPAVIALDVLLQGRDQANPVMLRALRASRGRVVLPYIDFAVLPKPGGGPSAQADPTRPRWVRANLLAAPDKLKKTGALTGFARLPDDSDGHYRRADYQVAVGSYLKRPHPSDPPSKAVPVDVHARSFAFAAANVARRGRLGRELERLPRASRRATGGQSESTTWIDYRGPPGSVRRVPALDILDKPLRPSTFAGKVVVIGATTRESRSVQHTPLDGGSGMPEPEIQANAIDTLMRGEPLRDVSRPVEILVILMLGCVATLPGLWASRRVGLAAIAAAAVAFLVATQLAFQSGWILAVVAPLAALVAAACGIIAVPAARSALGRVGRRPNGPVHRMSPR